MKKRSVTADEDRRYLEMAIEESRKCRPVTTAYSVGAVIVTAAGEIYRGYTHETAPANHAEEEALAKALAAGAILRGASIYSSMEPCSIRKSKPKSCSELILEQGFSRVVYALEEPACFVDCHGRELLTGHGVEVVVLDVLADRVREINAHIINRYSHE